MERYLLDNDLITNVKAEDPTEEELGLEILAKEPESNLGWRIMLGCDAVSNSASRVRTAFNQTLQLVAVIPNDERQAILAKATSYFEKQTILGASKETDSRPTSNIKVVSYEGSKGLSAQHVFLIGLHEGSLPRNSHDIKDIEVCRLLVGLTRTKK